MQNLEQRFQDAVQQFWTGRANAQAKQVQDGHSDTGMRGAVTAGMHMGALEILVADLLEEAGLKRLDIRTRTGLELPGYFRPEKKWDLLAVSDGRLVTAIEFKAQVGPSFGNNYNNRVEEAIGNATDLWTAFREGSLGSFRPFLGYFFLLEDAEKVHVPVKARETHFEVDPIFRNATYCQRYEALCLRLILERLYDGACLTIATDSAPTQITMPSTELDFWQFMARLQGHARAFADISSPQR